MRVVFYGETGGFGGGRLCALNVWGGGSCTVVGNAGGAYIYYSTTVGGAGAFYKYYYYRRRVVVVVVIFVWKWRRGVENRIIVTVRGDYSVCVAGPVSSKKNGTGKMPRETIPRAYLLYITGSPLSSIFAGVQHREPRPIPPTSVIYNIAQLPTRFIHNAGGISLYRWIRFESRGNVSIVDKPNFTSETDVHRNTSVYRARSYYHFH